MADQVVVDLAQYWETFTQLKKVLLRNVSLLSVIMFPLTYQVISVEFFVEEQSPNACNYTRKFDLKDRILFWNFIYLLFWLNEICF